MNKLAQQSLKPCPFCGGEVEIKPFVRDGSQDAHKVECFTCDVFVLKQTKVSTAEAWNKRVTPK